MVGEAELVGVIVGSGQREVADVAHLDGVGVEFLEFVVRDDVAEHGHLAIILTEQEVNHLVGQRGGQTTVIFVALTGTRDVAGNLTTSLDTETFVDFRGDDTAHAAKARVTVLVEIGAGIDHAEFLFLVIPPAHAFRDCDDEAVFRRTHVHLLHGFEEELFTLFGHLHLRNQCHLCATERGRTGEPTCVATHHFEHHNALVRLVGGVQFGRQFFDGHGT